MQPKPDPGIVNPGRAADAPQGRMNGSATPDPLDAAIAAAESTIQMMQLQMALPTGRPIIFTLPVDVTEAEILAGVGAYLAAAQQVRNAQPKSRIVMLDGSRAG